MVTACGGVRIPDGPPIKQAELDERLEVAEAARDSMPASDELGRARASEALADLAWRLGDFDRVERYLVEAKGAVRAPSHCSERTRLTAVLSRHYIDADERSPSPPAERELEAALDLFASCNQATWQAAYEVAYAQGEMALDEEEWAAASAHFDRALAYVGAADESPGARLARARHAIGQGGVRDGLGHPKAGAARYADAIGLLEALGLEGRRWWILALGWRAMDIADIAAARAGYKDALKLGSQWVVSTHPTLGAARFNLAWLKAEEQKYLEAKTAYLEGLKIAQRAYEEGHKELVSVRLELQRINRILGAYGEALIHGETILDATRVVNARRGDRITALNNTGRVYLERGDLAAACVDRKAHV